MKKTKKEQETYETKVMRPGGLQNNRAALAEDAKKTTSEPKKVSEEAKDEKDCGGCD